ncbi:hypothetical protein [Lacrimispora sp.]|nr:hypothetical protein [Lacrimispora sp.]
MESSIVTNKNKKCKVEMIPACLQKETSISSIVNDTLVLQSASFTEL